MIVTLQSFMSFHKQCHDLHGLKKRELFHPAEKWRKELEKDVLKILGNPVIKQEYGAQNWIYISSKSQKTVFSGKKLLERVVVRISFNQKGIATSVKMIPNDQHLSIDFAKRKTPTAGQEITILQQLIGNFGRFENKNDQSF